MQPENPIKSIKQQAEAWWAASMVVDPLKPAQWVLRGDYLDHYRNPFVLYEDDGRPFGAQTAV
jgi:hypothetical protein